MTKPSRAKKISTDLLSGEEPQLQFSLAVWARLNKMISSIPLCSDYHWPHTHKYTTETKWVGVGRCCVATAQTCLSVWCRCVAFINMRAVSVYPWRCIWYHPPPHTHHHHQRCGNVSWEPHKISLKTTRSAEANLWGPFILITTLWERFRNAIYVIVHWTDCWVLGSLEILFMRRASGCCWGFFLPAMRVSLS